VRIKYSIHASDSNSMYLDFWPIVSEIWVKKFNITPILIYIDNGEDSLLETKCEYGVIYKVKAIKDFPIHLQTQIIRFWYTSLFPDDVSIISDIDMLPMSIDYFINSIKPYDENSYIHLNSCVESYGRLPACYHVAKGSQFKKVLEIEEDWTIFFKKVLHEGDIECKINNLPIWHSDECYTSNKVLHDKTSKVILLKRKENVRIDRSYWVYDKSFINYDYYLDAHSIRPYSENKQEIEFLKNKIINSKNKKPSIILIFIRKIVLRFERIKNSYSISSVF